MTVTFKSLSVWLASLVVVWVTQLVFVPYMDPYFTQVIVFAGVNIILAVSLNIVNGFTGQFSMGHAGFMAVGAYASAFVTTTLQASHYELIAGPLGTAIFLLSLVFGGLLAAFIGYLVGLPSLRLKGDYLAIVTLGFGEIIRVLILNMDFLGAARGLNGIPPLANLGWVYTFVVITVFVSWRILRAPLGRAYLSVREDEVAAESMGVPTTKTKVNAFVISSFFAGIAGALFAHFIQSISPQTFDMNKSFEVIIMVVLGGMGSVSGSVIAAVFLSFLKEGLRDLNKVLEVIPFLSDYANRDYRMVIFSFILIVLMLTRPNGFFGTKEIKDFFKKSAGEKA